MFPGSVQWDGTYLTVFDQNTSETYQYTISGTTATLKNTIQFTGVSDCAQTWIVKGLLYCGDSGNSARSFQLPWPAVHRLRSLREASTNRSAWWQLRDNLRFSLTRAAFREANCTDCRWNPPGVLP